MTIPDYQSIMLPLLKFLRDKKEQSNRNWKKVLRRVYSILLVLTLTFSFLSSTRISVTDANENIIYVEGKQVYDYATISWKANTTIVWVTNSVNGIFLRITIDDLNGIKGSCDYVTLSTLAISFYPQTYGGSCFYLQLDLLSPKILKAGDHVDFQFKISTLELETLEESNITGLRITLRCYNFFCIKNAVNIESLPIEIPLGWVSLFYLQDGQEALVAAIANLTIQLSNLTAKFNELTENYTSLQTNYNSLKANHDSLKATYENLTSHYNELKSDYDESKLELDSLSSNYSILRIDFDALESGYESILNDLSLTRNIMYVFVPIIVTLAITTIYYAKRKQDK